MEPHAKPSANPHAEPSANPHAAFSANPHANPHTNPSATQHKSKLQSPSRPQTPTDTMTNLAKTPQFLHHAIAMLALAAAALAALAAAAYAQNGAKAFQRDGVPGSLLALGGTLGQRRPIRTVVTNVVSASLLGILGLALCDYAYARHTRARWFALHVIANIVISVLCVPDLAYMLSDPIAALTETRVNHWPTALIFSVHVYHMAFFNNLAAIDWLHHVLMVVVGAPTLITAEVGPMMDFNHFFMCGVPGGIDYALLFCVKHGWLTPLSEKRLNSAINVWLRAPALVATSVVGYIQIFLQSTPFWLSAVRAFLLLLGSWNGLFFMERVVGNYHINDFKHRQAAKAALRQSELARLPAVAKEDSYETEEHMLPSIAPLHNFGMGMRVSVSKQDLLAIDAIEAEAFDAAVAAERPEPAVRRDAYPTEAHTRGGRGARSARQGQGRVAREASWRELAQRARRWRRGGGCCRRTFRPLRLGRHDRARGHTPFCF